MMGECMDDQKKIPQPQPEKSEATEFQWRAKEGVPHIYTNFIGVTWTLFDVRIALGQLIPKDPGTKAFIVEECGSVTFAWPEAKAVRDILIALVEQYENANGEIKQPKLPPAPQPPTPSPLQAT